MTKLTLALMAGVGMLIMGCGSSGGSTYVAQSDPVEIPANTDITLSSGGDAELTYAYAEDGSIIVGGGNGDINIVHGEGGITNTTIPPAPVPPNPDTNDTNAT